MEEIKVIDISKRILFDNDIEADKIRQLTEKEKVLTINLMASPGSGKTSLLVQTIRQLRGKLNIAVIEGDIDSVVDSEKIIAEKAEAIQIQTGGACHLDASMVSLAMEQLNLADIDIVFIENIGNLICPVAFDTGADLKVVILSVPEGDDKPLKYPAIFSVCDVLVVNKIDYLPDPGFDMETLEKRVRRLNPNIKIFPVSCRGGTGLENWAQFLFEQKSGRF